MRFSFIKLIRFRGDKTPESSSELPWILIWRLVKPHMPTIGSIKQAAWLRTTFAESYRLSVNQAKKFVAVRD